MCYAPDMSTLAKLPGHKPETSVVPSIALEEVEPLTSAEREALLASLKAAEARVKSGHSIVYDRVDQRRRFEKIYSGRT
jgi:hypothetical protein